ncbi:MAG: peptidylprolyl isomerase [Proteobacteria bacterium]|nr:MAG: peptidylprolyl isomerase [Pseudomonadota bacterium]
MSVAIEKDMIVKLAYRLIDEGGRVLDERTPDYPYEYMQGRGQIVGPVERLVEGKTPGFRGEVHVTPKEGYGDYKPNLVVDIPRASFPVDAELEVDMKFNTYGEDGEPMTVRVIEVSDRVVTVDGNHPLAGLELNFEVRVLEVRAASLEEIETGRPGALPLAPGSGSMH